MHNHCIAQQPLTPYKFVFKDSPEQPAQQQQQQRLDHRGIANAFVPRCNCFLFCHSSRQCTISNFKVSFRMPERKYQGRYRTLILQYYTIVSMYPQDPTLLYPTSTFYFKSVNPHASEAILLHLRKAELWHRRFAKYPILQYLLHSHTSLQSYKIPFSPSMHLWPFACSAFVAPNESIYVRPPLEKCCCMSPPHHGFSWFWLSSYGIPKS